MEEELKTMFDEITKKIAEEEDNAIAKAFTMSFGNLLIKNGIKPILTKVEMPSEELRFNDVNTYKITSRYGYMFERFDTSDHDKQIIDKFVKNCENGIPYDICDGNEAMEFIREIAEQMKGEKNEL